MKIRAMRKVAARNIWDRLAESQAGELIKQDRQTIYLSSQALQTKLGDTASLSF
jgi:hypothetical protein